MVDPGQFHSSGCQLWILVDPAGSIWWILVDQKGGSWSIHVVDPGLEAAVPLFEQKKREYFFLFLLWEKEEEEKQNTNFQTLTIRAAEAKIFFSSSSLRK